MSTDKTIVLYEFVPDEELIAFAEYFAKTYKEITAGMYVSDALNYEIDYQDKPSGRVAYASVSMLRGEFVFIKEELIKENPETVIFLILWLRCRFEMFEMGSTHPKNTDLAVFNYYIKSGRPIEAMCQAMATTFNENLNATNVERLIQLENLKSSHGTQN